MIGRRRRESGSASAGCGLVRDMAVALNLKERPNPAASRTGPANETVLKRETLPDSMLTIAQSLWSRGNLSPLDTLFGSSAIVNLIPAKGFGFIGHHMGQRLSKYAEDSKADVDAAEMVSTLTRAHLKAKSPIRLYPWIPDPPVFKKSRHMAFIALQAGALEGGLEAVYGQAAVGLKTGGKLFAADLMLAGGDDARVKRICAGLLGGMAIGSYPEHVAVLQGAGLRVETQFDLTSQFLSSVRIGLQHALAMLEGLSGLDESDRIERTAAFAAQLATWKSFYDLTEAGKIAVTGLMAVKRAATAEEPSR